ncbi:mitotic apparatus protein p62-like [Macrobrachium rosenbergii]|uniref:mitotic apparatus protein p62-like n=1 Tax=Macrobrachium rosenbergii TaxID=79674 RepID=UPI0034D569C8
MINEDDDEDEEDDDDDEEDDEKSGEPKFLIKAVGMDDYEKDIEKDTKRMLEECDNPSEPDDDSEGESDLVEEDEIVSDFDCHETDSDDLQDEPQESAKMWWMAWEDKNTWWQKRPGEEIRPCNYKSNSPTATRDDENDDDDDDNLSGRVELDKANETRVPPI